MNEKLLNVSSSPHIRSKLSTRGVMADVIIALMPATIFGIYRFGLHAFLVVAASVLSAVITTMPGIQEAVSTGAGGKLTCFTSCSRLALKSSRDGAPGTGTFANLKSTVHPSPPTLQSCSQDTFQ